MDTMPTEMNRDHSERKQVSCPDNEIGKNTSISKASPAKKKSTAGMQRALVHKYYSDVVVDGMKARKRCNFCKAYELSTNATLMRNHLVTSCRGIVPKAVISELQERALVYVTSATNGAKGRVGVQQDFKCKVCSSTGNGKHYGANVCPSCTSK